MTKRPKLAVVGVAREHQAHAGGGYVGLPGGMVQENGSAGRTVRQRLLNGPVLDAELPPSAALDTLTTPTLNFPADILTIARMVHAGGTTINGEQSQLLPFGPTKPDDHY
jgi:hypothetical protein